MKQDRKVESSQDDFTSMEDMDRDIVEEFARQLDEVVHIQSEDEEEIEDNFGYQPLQQDDNEEGLYQQLESEEEEDPLQIDVQPSETLNPETSDLIKSIMANIKLSDEAIPDWAKKIPESAWLPRVNQKSD